MKSVTRTATLAAVAMIAGSTAALADDWHHDDDSHYKDLYELKLLHAAFHKAVSHAGIDAATKAQHVAEVLAVWTDDGTLITGGVTYSGKGIPGTASCEVQGDCRRRKSRIKRALVHIDADADDDPGNIVAVRFRFDQNAAGFEIADEDVIGPAQVDLQIRRRRYGTSRGKPCCQRNDGQVRGLHGRAQQNADVESLRCSRLP